MLVKVLDSHLADCNLSPERSSLKITHRCMYLYGQNFKRKIEKGLYRLATDL